MTPLSAFLVAAPIEAKDIGALDELLQQMNVRETPGMANPMNALVPFGCFPKLHFARFVILKDDTLCDFATIGLPKPDFPIRLAFLGECDGPAEQFLERLAEHPQTAAGLRRIFAYCTGFSGDTDLLQWMLRTQAEYPPAASYVNWLGRTVQQIEQEAALRDALVTYLGAHAGRLKTTDLQQIRHELLKAGESCTLTDPAPTPLDWQVKNLLHFAIVPVALLAPWVLASLFRIPQHHAGTVLVWLALAMAVFCWLMRSAPFGFALIAALGLLLVPFFYLLPWLAIAAGIAAAAFLYVLRSYEQSEPEIEASPSPEHDAALSRLEDHDVTNQFTVIGSVKPSAFRRWLLIAVLWAIDYGARHIYNRGFLARIRTIHFARWVFLDDKARVLFISNYDGSRQAYMDDFINKVAWGLNLAFGNGLGYPRTAWMIAGGAKNELRFKDTNRRHQIATQVWYKAYPGLTAVDLARNARVRRAFGLPSMSDAAIREWLKDL